APASDDVRVLRTERAGEDVFLVMNEGEEAVETVATFPATGAPELWDPDDGSARPAAVYAERRGRAIAVPLRLEPYEVQVVAFAGEPEGPHLLHSDLAARSVRRAGPRALEATVEVTEPGTYALLGADGGRHHGGAVHVDDPLEPIALGGPWRFRFDREGAAWVERPLGSWTALEPRWSGGGIYETSVELAPEDLDVRRMRLDLGAVRDVAEVSVNGVPAGRVLWRPYRVDVTEMLHAGANTIAVRVTNTNANERGSAQPSGLIGPVALRPYRVERVRLEHDPHAETVVLTAAPRTVELTGCGTRSVDVTVANHGRSPVAGELRLAAPDGVTATASETRVAVDGRNAETVRVDIAAAADTTDPSGVLEIRFGEQTARVELVAADRPNLAAGATVAASSTHPRFSAASVVNGLTDSASWDRGDGWNDDTIGAFPDWVELRLPCAPEVGRVDVHTLGSAQFPTSRFGIRDYDVQVLVDGGWATVDEVRGNTSAVVRSTFPPVRTDAVRVLVHSTNSGDYSRLIEVEVYREE
ncbi:MAG: glycosylhydrolase-like jelly roll fold domain-containing protein, partial [Solirubrobacteraceae bacterium]